MLQIQILLFGPFWIFFFSLFSTRLVEPMDAEPTDKEGQLYNKQTGQILIFKCP